MSSLSWPEPPDGTTVLVTAADGKASGENEMASHIKQVSK